MDLIYPQYTEDDENGVALNIAEYLDIDPNDENAGEIEGIPVFFNDESWVAAPGYEDELEAFLETIR